MRFFAVDPGLAYMGGAVLEQAAPNADIFVLDLYVIATTKTTNKKRRVTDDDVARMNMLWLNINQSVVDYQPEGMAVESYTVFRPGQGGQGKGAGWKALYAYAMTCAVAFHYGLPIYVFRPTDMKRGIAKNASATKLDVEEAVRRRVVNLDEYLNRIPDNLHEHAADAAGHGLCGLQKHWAKTS